MTNDICFKLTNQLTENTGQSVLVYMMPAVDRLDSDLFLSAWKVLNPSANGGSQRFRFRNELQLAVEHEPTLCRSAIQDVKPNQLYLATNSATHGPALQLSYSETPPNTRQVAVRNDTDPPLDLSAIWYVDGSPIAIQRQINLGATTTMQLSPEFYFIVALPTLKGVDQFSSEFPYLVPAQDAFRAASAHHAYRIPPGCRNVSVRWLRPGGMSGSDLLIFDPPSASPR
ncbi:MAG TPA: hypothetical protein VJ885_16790 [Thermoanaerobaculia bacterium]|nr:hypothetical protein [Thermoanaerobaculia bacterium]